MARGGPRKADGPSKKGAKATVIMLNSRVEPELRPPLPDPKKYLTPPNPFDILPQLIAAKLTEEHPDWAKKIVERAGHIEWHPVVMDWWEDIWDSPMAGEFIKSDFTNLYLAAKYLHHAVDGYTKDTAARAYGDKFERICKSYGLDPLARASLRWSISQGEMGQQRTNQLRERGTIVEEKKREEKTIKDLYSRHAGGSI